MNLISLSRHVIALFSSLVAVSTVMATSNSPENAAQIILYNKDKDTCSLDVPAQGSGLTYRYELSTFVTKCKGFETRSIELVQLPSALRVFLTDDPWCSDNTNAGQNFWLKLKTTRKSTTVGVNEITYLFTYPSNSIIAPGLLLESKYEKVNGEVRDKLSCIELVASEAFGTTWPPAATDSGRTWSDAIPEQSSYYTCTFPMILTGRRHTGFLNGLTRYECATAVQSGTNVSVGDRVWSPQLKESDGIYFVCPMNKIMTGRTHDGGGNGQTRYECATASLGGRDLTVTLQAWSDEIGEANSVYNCPAGQFLVGRWHKDNEFGPTKYRCAILK